MPTYIMDHEMTAAELRVYRAVHDACDARPGELLGATDIFPARNATDNANRRTFKRLASLGIFSSSDYEAVEDRGWVRVRSVFRPQAIGTANHRSPFGMFA